MIPNTHFDPKVGNGVLWLEDVSGGNIEYSLFKEAKKASLEELEQGLIAIFPQFDGFRAVVQREIDLRKAIKAKAEAEKAQAEDRNLAERRHRESLAQSRRANWLSGAATVISIIALAFSYLNAHPKQKTPPKAKQQQTHP